MTTKPALIPTTHPSPRNTRSTREPVVPSWILAAVRMTNVVHATWHVAMPSSSYVMTCTQYINITRAYYKSPLEITASIPVVSRLMPSKVLSRTSLNTLCSTSILSLSLYLFHPFKPFILRPFIYAV